jgi:hypothetical protein
MSSPTEIKDSDELYVIGLNEAGEYVSRDKKTGELLDTGILLSENIHYAKKAEDFIYKTTSGDNSAFFEVYEGSFIDGKRHGHGKYTAMDISFGQSTIDFTGIFVNNLPKEGTLKFMENGQFNTSIKGFFVNGLPDETKECEVIYTQYHFGEIKSKTIMKGFISFRNEKGVFPRDLEGKLSPNTPYNLLDVYLNFGFQLTGTRQIFPPPTDVGVFSSHGEKISLGGTRSKKRSNHKRKQSLKK